MSISGEGQMVLAFDSDISVVETTEKIYPEVVFDFNSLFDVQLI